MRSTQRALGRVYNFSRVAFWLYLAFIGTIIYQNIANTFGDKPKAPASAYFLPVDMDLKNVSDTIIPYSHKRPSGTETGTVVIHNGLSATGREEINTILTDSSYHKEIITNRFINRWGKSTPVQSVSGSADGAVYVNPDSIGFKILLWLRYFFDPVKNLIVLFFIYRSAKMLHENFSFSKKLAKNILYAGNAIILQQLFLLLTDWYISTRVHAATLVKNAGGVTQDVLDVSFSTQASLITIFIGLCLIALSRLLQHGYQIQQENELTI